jgi:hypothetical protein
VLGEKENLLKWSHIISNYSKRIGGCHDNACRDHLSTPTLPTSVLVRVAEIIVLV